MRASHCFIFLILLIAVSAFPQNLIPSVTESTTILQNATDNDIVPVEGIKSEISIPQDPEVIAKEVVGSSAPNYEIPSEVSISENAEVDANEIIAPKGGVESKAEILENFEIVATAPNEASISQNVEAIANETAAPIAPNEGITIADASKPIANEVVVIIPANKGNIEDARLIAFEDYSIPSALADIDTVNQVEQETVLEDIALRSLISSSSSSSSTTAASVDSSAILLPVSEVVAALPASLPEVVAALPASLPEVVADLPASLPEVVASLPSISDSPSSTETSIISSTSTHVPESSSVVSAPEAQVSKIPNVESKPKIPQPSFESDAQTPEARSVLTDFPDIEVIIPLVDVSLPGISARSLDSESAVSTISTTAAVSDFAFNISSTDVKSVSTTTEVPEPLNSSSTVVPNVESVVLTGSKKPLPSFEAVAPASDVVIPDSTNIEASQDSLPAVSLRILNAETGAPVEASNATVSDSESNNSSSVIESVSSTTEVPASSNSNVIPEIESIASSVVESTTEIPNIEVSSKELDAESPSSSSTNVSTSSFGLESESVSSTTSAPSTEVPAIEVVLPLAEVSSPEISLRSIVLVEASTNVTESESVSSTTAAAVQQSESDVTSSTEASVIIDSTSSPSSVLDAVTTETQTETIPQLSPTPSIPCAKAGNFSVPTNCRIYLTCSIDGTDLTLTENECPDRHVFSPVLRRCSRDISPCGDAGPSCLRPGSIADPNTSSAYYWCAPSLLGGYHKYHVHCDTNEVYVSSISRCLPEALHLSPNGVGSDLRSDRDIVKAEWKLLKKEIKHQAKEDKVRQKLEAKAKAHAEKLATKSLKKQKGDTKKYDESDDDDDDEDED